MLPGANSLTVDPFARPKLATNKSPAELTAIAVGSSNPVNVRFGVVERAPATPVAQANTGASGLGAAFVRKEFSLVDVGSICEPSRTPFFSSHYKNRDQGLSARPAPCNTDSPSVRQGSRACKPRKTGPRAIILVTGEVPIARFNRGIRETD